MSRNWIVAILLLGFGLALANGQDNGSPTSRPAAKQDSAKKKAQQVGEKKKGEQEKKAAGQATAKKTKLKGLLRLTPDYDIYLDLKRKLLVVEGEVCLREGQLEMFACPKGTKEHESVLSLNCRSQFVHAGLLALKAVPKHPVRFRPKYEPASGSVIDILVIWKDRQGKKRMVRAQDWVKNLRTGKPLTHDWVFGGSGFWVDEMSGEKFYHADGGELVCVSNFPTATMDLPIKSSQANSALLYGANTKAIPEVGTKVRVLFIPRVKAPAQKGKD